jgi:hypothetical protein
VRNDWDDDRLLGALRQALRAREAVPSWFIETGRNAFAWHNIDAELAQLTYDSNEDRLQATVMRSETASIRALTFTSAHLSVELEVTGNSLLGQLLPAREGELEIHTRAGEISTTEVDEIGCFSVDPIPESPFRLRCHTADGTHVLTGWITICGSFGFFGFWRRIFSGNTYQTGRRALRIDSRVRGGRGDPRTRRGVRGYRRRRGLGPGGLGPAPYR